MAVNPADVCLLLLSIVNKDLLFLIIESYDCNLMIRSYTRLSHIFFFCRSSLLSASIASSLSFHTVICWPLVIREQWADRWAALASHCFPSDMVVCLCTRHSEPDWFMLSGLMLPSMWYLSCQCVCLCVCVCLTCRPLRYFTKNLGDIQRNQTHFCLYPLMRHKSVIHFEFRLHMPPQLSPFTMLFANLCVSPRWACSDDSSSGERPLLP